MRYWCDKCGKEIDWHYVSINGRDCEICGSRGTVKDYIKHQKDEEEYKKAMSEPSLFKEIFEKHGFDVHKEFASDNFAGVDCVTIRLDDNEKIDKLKTPMHEILDNYIGQKTPQINTDDKFVKSIMRIIQEEEENATK
jgi:ribonucleotide monophosphatase NagD (HAD superfamily)